MHFTISFKYALTPKKLYPIQKKSYILLPMITKNLVPISHRLKKNTETYFVHTQNDAPNDYYFSIINSFYLFFSCKEYFASIRQASFSCVFGTRQISNTYPRIRLQNQTISSVRNALQYSTYGAPTGRIIIQVYFCSTRLFLSIFFFGNQKFTGFPCNNTDMANPTAFATWYMLFF